MTRDIPPVPLRMPPELNERVEKAMEESMRSKNAELVYRVARSFEDPLKRLSTGDLITELLSRYERGDIYIRIGKPGAEESGQ